MYGPSLCTRFQERRDSDVEISLLTSGCPFENVIGTPYKLWHIPVLLRTEPSPRSVSIPRGDSRIKYSGSWFPWTTVEDGNTNELPRATQTKRRQSRTDFPGDGS